MPHATLALQTFGFSETSFISAFFLGEKINKTLAKWANL